MRILGIDPGTRICGYAVLDAEGPELQAVDYGVIRAPDRRPVPRRLRIIFEGLTSIISRHEPQVAAVEGAFYGINARTATKIGEGRGVALLAAASADLEVHEYPPATVKKAVAGNGQAHKEQVQKMVRVLCSLREVPEPDDAADALALAICHAHRRRLEELT